MKLPAAILLTLCATQAHAASEAVCTQWALHAKADATSIMVVDRAYAWCLNQDLDPPLVDVPAQVKAVAPKTAKIMPTTVKSHAVRSEVAGPSCRHYRSFDPRTRTVLSYSHHREACR